MGTPLRHGDHVEAEVLTTNEEHTTLLNRIVAVLDLQCAWLLLLFCAPARANYLLRVVHPSCSDAFARAHDTSVWNSVSPVVRHPQHARDDGQSRDVFSKRRVGVAERLRGTRSAHIGPVGPMHCPQSGSGILPSLTRLCVALQHGDEGPHIVCCSGPLQGAAHHEWVRLSRVGGRRQGVSSLGRLLSDDPMPGIARRGWQRGAALHVEKQFRTAVVWPRLHPREQALLRSQSGPLAGVPFSCVPSSAATRFESQEFRVLLLRRLWCPLPLSASSCRCGRPLDPSGHHRAACPHAGVLGRRGFSV